MTPYAHSAPEGQPWEPLFTPFGNEPGQCRRNNCEDCRLRSPGHGHLNKVAWWCATFAAEMFPPGPDRDAAWQWGYLAGLWHDLGKFPPEWQVYLASKADPHLGEISGKIDHSTAGARHAVEAHPILGHLLAYMIAGHHSGLLDGRSNGACQEQRLRKQCQARPHDIAEEIASFTFPQLPPSFRDTRDGYTFALLTRMLFSCLVDADFLATEAFINASQAGARNATPAEILSAMAALLEKRIDRFGKPAVEDGVNRCRRAVVDECRSAAKMAPGLFSLTVPTGGGKTLSSLLFALRHAIVNGQRRVIYVVPFTSIIEQNAGIIREIFASLESPTFTPVIEHHSSLSPDQETLQSRLAAENWDAPVIITTAVQFYESLHAAKTSRCRKLHGIANSVVILDEAQTLPVDFLSPCLRVLQELADRYHTTTVLCTATQPAVHFHEKEFKIGLRNCREIISDPAAHFAALKRVEIKYAGDLSNAALAARLADHPQVLCIVNRRKHAQQMFQLLEEHEGNYHLSALMCPEHRSLILAEIRDRLEQKLPVRVISTQLIEAGVDVDFPVVYRALAGLDSIAQAAGRCNRNGKLPGLGKVLIFRPEDSRAETYFRETAQVTAELIDVHSDLLGQKAIRHYFDLYYYRQGNRWDSKSVLESFRLESREPAFPFHFQFATAAKEFRLIEQQQVPVIVSFDEKARKLVEELRNPAIPLHKGILRGLQRYTVQIPPALRDANIRSFEALRDGQFHVLTSNDLNYSADFGLTFDETHAGEQHLICN
jgi:CRISPR-associated endonuclease/helicase Cas3